MHCQFVKCNAPCVSFSKLFVGENRKGKILFCQREKNILLLLLNPVQLLPACRYRQSRLYKTSNGLRGRQNQQQQMFGGHPSPARTNKEAFNNREHSNLPDLLTLFRLLWSHITKSHSRRFGLLCFPPPHGDNLLPFLSFPFLRFSLLSAQIVALPDRQSMCQDGH